MVHVLCLAAAVLASVLVSACDVRVQEGGGVSLGIQRGGTVRDEWRRTYTLAPGGRLSVTNLNGRIDVSPGGAAEVVVEAAREVRARDDEAAKAALEKVSMSEDVGPNHVSLEAVMPGEERSAGPGRGAQLAVRYRIRVPDGLALALRTANGALRLDGVQGAMVLAATNGSIEGERLRGAVEARTVNGSVRLDMAQLAGDLRAETVNGSILVALPREVGAAVEVRTVNGGIRVDEQFVLSGLQRDRTRMAGTLNQGGPRIVLQTTNGRVDLSARPES